MTIYSGTSFTKMPWAHQSNLMKIRSDKTWKMVLRSGHKFPHVTTTQLSCHMQIYDVCKSINPWIKWKKNSNYFNHERIYLLHSGPMVWVSLRYAHVGHCLAFGTSRHDISLTFRCWWPFEKSRETHLKLCQLFSLCWIYHIKYAHGLRGFVFLRNLYALIKTPHNKRSWANYVVFIACNCIDL